jgi:hypothetical protein
MAHRTYFPDLEGARATTLNVYILRANKISALTPQYFKPSAYTHLSGEQELESGMAKVVNRIGRKCI